VGGRVLSVLVRPTAPPVWLGLLVAAAATCAETLFVVMLRTLAPMDTFGVVFLLGALIVAIGLGEWSCRGDFSGERGGLGILP
jgi:hypothetical protein